MMNTYDYIIVGGGFFGAVFAQQVKEAGKTALVLEKRNHIGGICYSYNYEDTGISIHAYGTHICSRSRAERSRSHPGGLENKRSQATTTVKHRFYHCRTF
jgi:UDP-galactopyranose mutase